MSVKERLRKKLEQKKHVEPLKDKTNTMPLEAFVAYDQRKQMVVMHEVPQFKFIERGKGKIDPVHLRQRASIDAYLVERIKAQVEEKIELMKGFPPAEILKTAFNIYVATNAKWMRYHLDSLPMIENSALPELRGAHITSLHNHTIYIINDDSTCVQSVIDFMGLCWLRDFKLHTGVEDIGRDIIVSLNGYLCFFAVQISFIFQAFFVSHELVHPLLEGIAKPNTEHVTTYVEEFDEIRYPSLMEQRITKEYLTLFPTWSHYKQWLDERREVDDRRESNDRREENKEN